MAIRNESGCFWDDGKFWPELAVADIRVENHGTIAHLFGLTDAGKAFLTKKMKSEGWQCVGDALCIEPRMVQDIINRAEQNGLNVETG